MRRPLTLAIVALIATVWSAALVAAPAARAPRLAAVMYAAGSVVCHQQSARSFHYNGVQYPVCARCLGLYLGATAGALGWVILAGLRTPRIRVVQALRARARQLLVVTALPTLLTVITAALGWWDPGNIMRAVLAVPLGGAIATVVAAVAAGDLR